MILMSLNCASIFDITLFLTNTISQGRNIYDGCCQLDIQYSNLSELQVHYNNDRSRDFTNPSLPTEQRPRTSQQGYPDPAGLYAFQQPGGAYQMGRAAMIAAAFGGTLPHGVTGTNERCTLIVSNLNTDKIDEDKLFNLFSLYGNIVRIKILRNKPDHALVEMADGLQAELAVHYLKVQSHRHFSSQLHSYSVHICDTHLGCLCFAGCNSFWEET
ncbi:hypothetical protein SEVIR_3G233600v4 [Setaria viridis]